MDSPFAAGGVVQSFPALTPDTKLVIRVEKIDAVQVNLKKNGTPSATAADYFLTGGDSIEVTGPNGVVINALNVSGDPKVYWTLEPSNGV